MKANRPSPLIGVDLQLLVVLDLLLEAGSVTTVAHKLRVSQSAMSHTLRRLREVFGDSLLVRGRSGMVLTSRAQELREPLRRCLGELVGLVESAQPFAPETSDLLLRISVADFPALHFAPALLDLAQREAPHVRFEIKGGSSHGYIKALENGDLDLTIGCALMPEHVGLMRCDLSLEPMACAVRVGHPRIRGQIRLEDYVRESHVLVSPTEKGQRGLVDLQLDRLGLKRNIAANVASFLLAPHIVAGSDLMLTAPRTLLEAYAAPIGLAMHTPPFELAAFPVQMFWHERTHSDPARRWLRETVIRAYAAPKAPPR
jgi:DNA-binding transcriptional LysR family regulator